MSWGRRVRPWATLVCLVVALVIVVAVPAGLKVGHPGWPKWLVAAAIPAIGIVVDVLRPLLKARTDHLATRTKRKAEQQDKAQEILERLPGRAGKTPLVREITDRGTLGIHEAIPLPDSALHDSAYGGLSTDLPFYVTRDIDAGFRTALQANTTTGGFLVLVGPAAAGKTRCAFEGLRAIVPDWNLLLPNNGAEINELVDNNAISPQSVIWLNETQDFLTGTIPLAAATIRRLRADTSRPVILIGTIWPDRYEQLRTPALRSAPEPGQTDDEGQEATRVTREQLGRNARDVLEQARTFRLHGFSPDEWDRVNELTTRDPRLAQAAHHRPTGLGLTQLLSATPELLHRWEQADNPHGKAILTAAVTARRCGHPATIPASVLEVLAPEFLTGAQRANLSGNWLTDALNWACKPVHHTTDIAPLAPHAAAIGQTHGYRVSDILTNHATPTNPAPTPHTAHERLWQLLTAHAAPEAGHTIGLSAYQVHRRAVAVNAWTRAAEAGNSSSMFNLGVLLADQGDLDSARSWWTRAAEAGNSSSMFNLGVLLADQGDLDSARSWWTRAAEAGDTDAMFNLGVLLADQDDLDNARTWHTRAAEADNTNAMFNLGTLLQLEGDLDGARSWWTRAAEAGETDAMVNLGILLHRQDDLDGARTWHTRAAEAGDTDAMNNLGVLLADQDDLESAHSWWTRAAEADNTDAMFNLSVLLADQDDLDGARTWYTRAAEADNTRAMVNLGTLLQLEGDLDGARTWWTRAAEAGETTAVHLLEQF